MQQIKGREVAKLLTELIVRLVPESRAISLASSLSSGSEFSVMVEKYSDVIDDIMINLSFTKSESGMREIIKNLPEDVFRMFMSRWATSIKNILITPDAPVIFGTKNTDEDLIPAIIRLSMVNNVDRVADVYPVD